MMISKAGKPAHLLNPARREQMKHCAVELTGTNGRKHVITLDAESLFDAASKALDACAKLSWYDKNAVLTVEADGKRWRVDPGKVKEWRVSRGA
jgi:hypothetical protein